MLLEFNSVLGARRNRAEQDTLGHHSHRASSNGAERSVPMRKKRDTTSGLRGVLPAALVLLGWISYIAGQAILALPLSVKLILLVVARVLPQALLVSKQSCTQIGG